MKLQLLARPVNIPTYKEDRRVEKWEERKGKKLKRKERSFGEEEAYSMRVY